MIRRWFCAVFVMTGAIGIAVAGEFNATIIKVDGATITYQKYKKAAKKWDAPEKDGDPVTISVASDLKVVEGKYDKDAKKVVPGDPIEGGLKSETFTKSEKGIPARITTDADNKTVIQILVTLRKKKAGE